MQAANKALLQEGTSYKLTLGRRLNQTVDTARQAPWTATFFQFRCAMNTGQRADGAGHRSTITRAPTFTRS